MNGRPTGGQCGRYEARRAVVAAALTAVTLGASRAASQPAAPPPAPGMAPAPGAATPPPGYGTQRTCSMRGGQSVCYSSGPAGYCYWVGSQVRCFPAASAAPQPPVAAPTGPPGSGAPPTAGAGAAPGTGSSGPSGFGTGPAMPGVAGPSAPGSALASGPTPGAVPAPGGPGTYEPGPWPLGMVEGEDLEQGARTLGGHTFPYPRYFRPAFVATSVGVGAGVEFYSQSDVEVNVVPTAGEPTSYVYDRELVFARLRADLDLAFADVFGLGIAAEYLAQVGVSEQSLFLYGAETGYRIAPHLSGRLWRSSDDASQLALHVVGDFSGGLRAVPQGLLRELAVELAEIAQDQGRVNCLVAADFECAFDEVDLVTAIQLRRRTYGASAALGLAHAFDPVFGLQLSLGLGGGYSSYSWRYVGAVDAGTFRLAAGIGPSLNFAPAFPLGIALEYQFELEHSGYSVEAGEDAAAVPSDESATETGHRLGAGFYFTGRRDLMLGAIVGLSFVDESAELGKAAADQPMARLVTLQFDLRYFF